jgi:hypothetical protein
VALLVHAAKVEPLIPDLVTITPMTLVHTGPDGANGLDQVLHVGSPKDVKDEHATVAVLTTAMDPRQIVNKP